MPLRRMGLRTSPECPVKSPRSVAVAFGQHNSVSVAHYGRARCNLISATRLARQLTRNTLERQASGAIRECQKQFLTTGGGG